MDRRRRRRKFLATTFLRTIGYATDEEVLREFYRVDDFRLSKNPEEEALATKLPVRDVLDGEIIVARAYEPLTVGIVRQLL